MRKASTGVFRAVEGKIIMGKSSYVAPVTDSMALALAIRSVRSAISTDLTRPHLASVHVIWDRYTVTVEATDGHRAHRCSFVSQNEMVPTVDALFQIGAAKIGPKTTVKIRNDGGAIFLILTEGYGGAVTTVPEMRGLEFPPVSQIIPKNRSTVAVPEFAVNGEYLAQACTSGALIAGNKTQGVRLCAGNAPLDPFTVEAISRDDLLHFVAVLIPMRF